MRHVTDAERRQRLARRHALAPAHRVPTVVEAVEAVEATTVLHATEPATVYLSCWSRVEDAQVENIDRALYVGRPWPTWRQCRSPSTAVARAGCCRTTSRLRSERKNPRSLCSLLDPTVRGWKQRDFYLGSHRVDLHDRNSHAGTTAWVDGRVVGCWTQGSSGDVGVHLLELRARTAGSTEAEVARLTEWLAGQRIGTVYPSPAMKIHREDAS